MQEHDSSFQDLAGLSNSVIEFFTNQRSDSMQNVDFQSTILVWKSINSVEILLLFGAAA